jgi:uncharacterized protein (UPF0332 family)
MPFNGKDFLALAYDLANNPSETDCKCKSEEAKYRTAISRAYYAAHWEGRKMLRKIFGISLPKNGTAHRLTIDTIRNEVKGQEGQFISTELGRLFTDRNKADYDSSIRNDINKLAKSCHQTANTIIFRMNKIINRQGANP